MQKAQRLSERSASVSRGPLAPPSGSTPGLRLSDAPAGAKRGGILVQCPISVRGNAPGPRLSVSSSCLVSKPDSPGREGSFPCPPLASSRVPRLGSCALVVPWGPRAPPAAHCVYYRDGWGCALALQIRTLLFLSAVLSPDLVQRVSDPPEAAVSMPASLPPCVDR